MRQAQLIDKTAWVCRELESRYGRPQQPGRARNPLDQLIRTVLSQNTSDTNSDRAYKALRARFATWEAVLGAPRRSIAAAIRCGGLARQKSRRIRAILRWVQRQFGRLSLSALHRMTDDEVRRLLAPLPGIGPKTVSVLLAFALGRDVFPVDTHVHRVTRRLGLIAANATAERAHQLMAPLVGKGKAYSLHVNLIRLGRQLCRPRRRECKRCPLRLRCRDGRTWASQASPSGPAAKRRA